MSTIVDARRLLSTARAAAARGRGRRGGGNGGGKSVDHGSWRENGGNFSAWQLAELGAKSQLTRGFMVSETATTTNMEVKLLTKQT